LDVGTAVLLLTDYVLRFYVASVKLQFFINLLNLADFVGLLPVLLGVLVKVWQWITRHNNYGTLSDEQYLNITHIVNMLRMLRVLRMFRMIRMYKPFKVVFWAWKASYQELILLVIIITVATCVFGSIIYYIELNEDRILSIPHGMYWALITMTTVGYGDVAPVTPLGALAASCCAITGLLIIAVPIPVIVQNFHRYYEAVQTTSRLKRKPEKMISDSFISSMGKLTGHTSSAKIVPIRGKRSENRSEHNEEYEDVALAKVTDGMLDNSTSAQVHAVHSVHSEHE
jgi:hypothetical protein